MNSEPKQDAHESNACEELLSRVQIIELLNLYCFYFDSNNTDGLRELFDERAVVDYGPEVDTLHGIDEVMTSIAKGLQTTFEATSHHLSNQVITFDDVNNARSNSYVFAWHRYKTKAEIGYLWGQYSHVLRRNSGTWKISELTLRAVATQDFHRATMHPVVRNP